MKFISMNHRNEYQALAGSLTEENSRLTATVYALSGIGMAHVIKPLIHGHYIDMEALITEGAKWSSGEKALLKLASNIYDSDFPATIHEVFSSLDDENTKLALETLRLRYHLHPGLK